VRAAAVESAAVEVLEVLGDFERSRDRKVSPLVAVRSSKEEALVANSLGVPAGPVEDGGTCPGYSAAFCGDCYAMATARHWSTVRALLGRNLERFEALDEVGGWRAVSVGLRRMLEAFELEAARRGVEPVFRPYWSGDLRGIGDAYAWRAALRAVPGVRAWQYTRTLAAVPVLAEVERLVLFVSVDDGNVREARRMLARYPRVRAALCSSTFEDAAALRVGRGGGLACPENGGRLPLVAPVEWPRRRRVEVGEVGQGACIACGFCVERRAGRPVLFSESGR
jgi:hypothetical protein